MSKKTLLLNATYEVLSFISERRAFKLLCNNKVEVISSWEDLINWGSTKINHPSILRLKKHIKVNFNVNNFSRKAVIKRDKLKCQYCNEKLTISTLTIDHVLPKCKGGKTSFTNCVVCCQTCNNKKADMTPEQAGMVLLNKPTHPSFSSNYGLLDPQEHWHIQWNDFLSDV